MEFVIISESCFCFILRLPPLLYGRPLKSISNRLLWIETGLFRGQDQRDVRLRWFVPGLLLQI
jgi:hypothetical protein